MIEFRTGRGRLAAIGLSLVWLSALATLGCGTAGSASEEPAADDEATLRRGDFRRELLLTGELQAVRSIAIKAPETSIFQMRIQFMAEEGEFLRAGEPLLDFDSSALVEQVRDLESRILDAETQIVTRENELASSLKDLEIELAEKQFAYESARLEASVDPEVLSRREYGDRQLALTRATDELNETHARIELTRKRGEADLDVLRIDRDKLKRDLFVASEGAERLSIVAPSDGLVVYEKRRGTTLRFQEGDSCWPGQTVMRLPDLDRMQVQFLVNEVDAPLLEVGMPVRIWLDAFAGRELEGRIERIPSMAVKRDENSKIAVFKVVAGLSETWVGEMKPGMSALGSLVIENRRDVPLIARAAVRVEGERYVLAATGETIEPVDRNASWYVLSEQDFARLGGSGPETAGRLDAAGGES